MMILLSVGMLAGCHEGHHTRRTGMDFGESRQFALEPTQTGLWHSEVTYGERDQDR
jgi:hypothetical protein